MASSGTIGKINAGGNDYLVASTALAVCDTSANIAAKVATIQDGANFTLMDGVTIHVYFDASNTASNPTLNVNNTGAYSIYFANNVDTAVRVGTTPTDSWAAGAILTLTYYSKSEGAECWYINNNAPAIFPVVFTPTSQDFTTATSSKYAYEIALALGNGQMPIGLLAMGQNLFATSYLTYAGMHPLTQQVVAIFSYSCYSTNVLTHLNYHYATLTVDNSGNVTIEWTDLVHGVTLDSTSIVNSSGVAQLTTGTSSGTLATGDHTHGNITTGGDITTNVAIASGDRLVINDESESKINNSSITFGSSTTQFLANNGTWQTPAGGVSDVTVNGTSVVSSGVASITGDLTDTKNTAGSTDTSSKIYLIGATSQAANPQTYSDNQVYATDGQLDANKVRVAEHATMQWNSTDSSLDFIFS